MLQSLKLQLLLLAGVLMTGFWLPFRLIGFEHSLSLDVGFSLLISTMSAIDLAHYFRGGSWRNRKLWFRASALANLICLLPLPLLIELITGKDAGAWFAIYFLVFRHVGLIKSFLDHFDSLHPLVYRMVPLIALLPPIVHVTSCGWIALGSGTSEPTQDHVLEYVRAIYWTFTTLLTVGYGDITAKTIPQMLYACGIQVIGVGTFGYILSSVASVMSRADAAREHHMDNLDKIETFMNIHHTPHSLKSEVRAYYHYLWLHKKGYQDRSLLNGLPHKIQSELLLHINRPIIEKVPFLKGAGRDLLEDLTGRLESRVVIPGERIFRMHDPGDALYFIQSGQVEIIGKDNDRIATLVDGAFFGEMALISDRPRQASAQALTFCDLYVLKRDAFERVIRSYPEFKKHLDQVALERTRPS